MRITRLAALLFVPTACSSTPTASVTYEVDVAPILDAKCVQCHQSGGIAPFRLDTFDDAKAHAVEVAGATKAKTMPPYLVTHDGTCGNFVHDETLTDAEIATISSWVDQGAVQGPATTHVIPPVPKLDGTTDYSTPNITPIAQGGQFAEHDEYRCFPIDAHLDKNRFITDYEVDVGNPAIVHHVIAFLIDPNKPSQTQGMTNGDVMQALDAADPDRPGWPCFGMAGDGLTPDAVPVTWAPGQGIVHYPSNIGVEQTTTQKLVVQMHYNLADVQGQSDSTTVRLRYADTVDRKGIFVVSDGFLDTLFSGNPDTLAPHQSSVSYTWQKSAAQLGLGPLPYVDVVGVMPHMHERGRSKQIEFVDGSNDTCGAHVDHWDFHWQKFYFYEDASRPRITPTTNLKLTCEYDTSSDDAPVLPGWGTQNEMCTAIMMLALPPGL
jgi:hypothetical protein